MNSSFKILLLSLFLCSLSLRALENNDHDFHGPTLAKELRDIAELHAQKSHIIGDNVKGYAKDGFLLPMSLAATGGAKVFERKGATDAGSLAGALIGGFLGWAITLPITIPTGILGSLAGSVVGLGAGISKAIEIKHSEAKFEDVVTAHLIHWIAAVKEARLKMRTHIEKHMSESHEPSVKEAFVYLLEHEEFKLYLKHTELNKKAVHDMIDKISSKDDCFGSFFTALSMQVKRKDIADNDWKHLENKLTKQAPTMKEDIAEYLSFSVYFFTMLDKKGLEILRSYIEETSK